MASSREPRCTTTTSPGCLIFCPQLSRDMPRAARFSDLQILDTAAAIIADGGPGAATIGEIGHRLGAPSGSIYHRFPSRNALLGRLWMQKAASFQDRFVQALQNDDAERAGLEAALSMPRSVRLDPIGAKISCCTDGRTSCRTSGPEPCAPRPNDSPAKWRMLWRALPSACSAELAQTIDAQLPSPSWTLRWLPSGGTS